MEAENVDGDLGNGNHFLTLLRTESTRLKALVCAAEHELEADETVPEDVRGKLRVAVGKAKMLLKKKFTQFEELCLENLGIESKFRYTVTCEDLAGYWDTILLQIVQVYNIFEEVETLRKNNWKESAPPILEKKDARKLNGSKTILTDQKINNNRQKVHIISEK